MPDMNDPDLRKAQAQDIVVDAWCDVFRAGRHWEDAEEIIGENWMVRATLPNGRRFVHKAEFRMTHFCAVSACHDYDGDEYIPCKAHAAQVYKSDKACQDAAEKLVARIQEAQRAQAWEGPFNENWSEVEPAYGSEEYEKQGCEAERAEQERREDGNHRW